MLEWTASVMIAIDPVAAPAAIFNTISVALEATDNRAALSLLGAARSGRAGASPEVGCAAGLTASVNVRLMARPRGRRRCPAARCAASRPRLGRRGRGG